MSQTFILYGQIWEEEQENAANSVKSTTTGVYFLGYDAESISREVHAEYAASR